MPPGAQRSPVLSAWDATVPDHWCRRQSGKLWLSTRWPTVPLLDDDGSLDGRIVKVGALGSRQVAFGARNHVKVWSV